MTLPARSSEGPAAHGTTTAYSGYLHILTAVDAVTFTVKRPYPRWAARCLGSHQALLRIVVKRPSVSGGLARVVASAELCEGPTRDGDALASSMAAKPLLVLEDAEFFYDPALARFYRSGPVATTIESILDTIYADHCRTLRWHVRVMAAAVMAARTWTDGARRGVQDVAFRLLRVLHGSGDVVGAPRA